jgi:hypothetical protein
VGTPKARGGVPGHIPFRFTVNQLLHWRRSTYTRATGRARASEQRGILNPSRLWSATDRGMPLPEKERQAASRLAGVGGRKVLEIFIIISSHLYKKRGCFSSI